MRIIDIRSDTVTRPTPSMRRAMANAEVGDDVFGEDPTVNRLEELSAEKMGTEAALFVSSGTMANLVSQMTHCNRGAEMILGDQAHIFFNEQGGSAAIGGIHPRTVRNQSDGTIALDDIRQAIRPDNVHFPRTRLIVLENTHNFCCGSPLSLEYMIAVGRIARENHIKIYVDGARIFNAAVALKVSCRELVAPADSVSFCLSKGLAAPAGSMVCGSREFINEARRVRKVLGGGMRQAGILAAAGIVALTEMVERLAEDHLHARQLANGLADVKGIVIDPQQVKTNIVFFETVADGPPAEDMTARLQAEGVLLFPVGPRRFRAVTNYHVGADDIEYVIKAFQKILSA